MPYFNPQIERYEWTSFPPHGELLSCSVYVLSVQEVVRAKSIIIRLPLYCESSICYLGVGERISKRGDPLQRGGRGGRRCCAVVVAQLDVCGGGTTHTHTHTNTHTTKRYWHDVGEVENETWIVAAKSAFAWPLAVIKALFGSYKS